MNQLVAIIGPTASGKSHLAIQIAQLSNGEIISADSRQIYRFMDIGTAKSSPEELALVPHHLIDIINPDEDFSLAQYQEMVFSIIETTHKKQRLPLLVGGSGLYVWSVLEGWNIPAVEPDSEYRKKLENEADSGEIGKLFRELKEVDSVAAGRIDPRNVRRVIRALEVSKSGIPISRLQDKKPPSFNTLVIGLTAERKELYRRIDLRVDEMIKQGLVEEVKKLVEMGYKMDLPSMSGIGYRQISSFLAGELTLELAIRKIKTETHRLARKQYNWFRLTDDRINWLDITSNFEQEAIKLVSEFVSK